MSKLVNHYLKLHNGKTEAAKDLKTNLGCTLGRAYEWLNPSPESRQPPKKVLEYMRLCVTKLVLDDRLRADVPKKTADTIAKDLS